MKISVAEGQVLDVLWRLGAPATAEDVTASLEGQQDWARGTVRSLLRRLVGKKAVKASMEGRRCLYTPLIEQAGYAQTESKNLLNRFFDGKLAPFVTQFTEQESLSDDDLAALRQLMERLDRDR